MLCAALQSSREIKNRELNCVKLAEPPKAKGKVLLLAPNLAQSILLMLYALVGGQAGH